MTLEALKDLFGQLQNATPEIVVGACLIALGYALKTVPQIPNKLIPSILLLIAMIGYPLIADNGSAPYSMKFPVVRHVMLATVIWFIQWRIHDLVLKKFVDRLLPQAMDKKGDTKFFPNPDSTPKP